MASKSTQKVKAGAQRGAQATKKKKETTAQKLRVEELKVPKTTSASEGKMRVTTVSVPKNNTSSQKMKDTVVKVPNATSTGKMRDIPIRKQKSAASGPSVRSTRSRSTTQKMRVDTISRPKNQAMRVDTISVPKTASSSWRTRSLEDDSSDIVWQTAKEYVRRRKRSR